MKNSLSTLSIIKLVALGALVWALANNPYVYYQILRWFISLLTAYSAYQEYKEDQTTWVWILGIMAIVYNPIAPFFLDKSTWSIINIVTGIFLFKSIRDLKVSVEG